MSRFLGNVSRKSYYKSFSVHLLFFMFVILPLSFLVPQYLDSGHVISTGSVKVITISEKDYAKITNKTTQAIVTPPSEKVTQEVLKNDQPVTIVKKTETKIIPKNTPKPKKLKKPTSLVNITKKDNSINKTNKIPESSPAMPQVDQVNQSLEDPKSNEETLQSQQDNSSIPDAIDIVNIENPQTNIFGDSESVVTTDIKISIKDIIAVQLNRCWNEYYDESVDAKKMVITAVIGYRQNGSVNKIDIENKVFFNEKDSNLYQIMSQNAKRAIMNCSPLKGMPTELYDDWKIIKTNFKQGKK